MKELENPSKEPDFDYRFYYSVEYGEPLLEYVKIIADKYNPAFCDNEGDLVSGTITFESQSTSDFAIRYFQGKVDKSFEKKFSDNKEVIQSIEALGLDVDKFWYLLLFINDYCFGKCFKGIKYSLSAKEKLNNFFNVMLSNIKTLDNRHSYIEVTYKKPIELVLKIKGKHSIKLDDPFALLALIHTYYTKSKDDNVLNRILESKERVTIMDKNGFKSSDPEPNSVHICYFAKMLISFFELKTTIKSRSKDVSYNKLLLISRLIYIVGLSKNNNFLHSDDTLKGYLKQYKDYNPDRFNTFYW